ncbi:MAG TPA: sugar ABC transporter permease [Roseiflexaceae bacterium]|nr:sugar ABC transporter permease [Roseiflexaceae bacterium]
MAHTERRPVVGARVAPPLRRTRRISRKAVTAWLFVLPILLLFALVVIGPSFAAVYYSFTDWSGIGDAQWVGLANFRKLLFQDMSFRKAFTNNVIWMFIFLTVPVAMALVAAGVLAPVRRGGMIFRAAIFIPYILPTVIVAQIWRNLLSPTQGVGAALADIGIQGLDKAFLGQSSTALYAIAFVNNWQWWGFLMVLFLAAMQNIPRELYEAARIDGATRWDEFRFVTIPGIKPTLVFMLLMTAIWSFLIFDYVFILTQGGPAGSSEVLGTLLYKNAFNRFEAGYASALGLTMSFFAGVIICIYIALRRRGVEE